MRHKIFSLLTVVALAAGLLLNGGIGFQERPAHAAGTRPLFQLPFPCGQQWVASTYNGHSPNTNSLDMIRSGGGTNGAPIVASAAGTVTFAGWDSGGGWMVNLKHANGWGTTYLHMIARPPVSAGQTVSMGTVIGRVGSTGDSRVPHLHYQQWADSPGNTVRSVFNGVPVNVSVGHSQTLTSHNCGGGPRFDRDMTADGWDDIIGRNATDNQLYIYEGFAPGKLASPRPLGGDWGAMTALVTGDFTGEGHGDLVAKRTDGALFLYAGYGDGKLSAPKQLATGWGNIDTVVAADFTDEGRLDLMGRRSDGTLFLYAGHGNGDFQAPKQIATGWGGITAIVAGDFNGDGRGDLVGRAANGDLNLYAGRAGTTFDAPRRISHGWNGITALIPGDFNHDGRADIAGRASDGTLLLYRATADGTLTSGLAIGSGWNGLDLFQS